MFSVGYIVTLYTLCRYWSVLKGALHHHHHQHQGLDPLIRSVSKFTTVFSSVSSVFQLFSFLVVSSSMISKVFGFVAFFANVEASSFCSQRRRIEAAEMKLLRPLAGYTLYDHKTNEYIRRELKGHLRKYILMSASTMSSTTDYIKT